MLRSLLPRRALAITIAGIVSVPLVGYLAFMYPHRASFELSRLKKEYGQRYAEVGRVYREDVNSPELSNAKAEFEAWQDKTRSRCMQIAAANRNNQAGATALLMVAGWWPESPEAEKAHAELLALTQTLPMDDLGWALNNGCFGHGELETWRPFTAQIIDRVHHEPDHQDSAWVLCKASCLVKPNRYSASGPCKEFIAIAELVRSKFPKRKNIQNFCEMVGGNGTSSEWSLAFEPHLREILSVNQDRLVRCAAKFNLASIVRAGGIDRQAEAEQLFEEFLEEFDGQTEYPAQGVEVSNREKAQRILERMRHLGPGKAAVSTMGIDLKGQSMSLSDYRGKVVLLSFWATWCGSCMKAIPHEKELAAHFALEEFAIVGVNGDSEKPDRALAAVQEHGITWRSFQNKGDDGSRIDRAWHIGGWPTFYLLDANGTISKTWHGLPPQAKMQDAVSELIEKAKQQAPAVVASQGA